MIRVMLADDEPVVRRGLRMRLKLEPDFQIVGEAGDGEQVLQYVQECKPDVIVMDVSMPRLNGIEATAALTRQVPGVAVVILTLHGDRDTEARAQAAGAAAFLIKGGGENGLIAAIRNAAGKCATAPPFPEDPRPTTDPGAIKGNE